jgi:hypothetical protein
VGTPTSRYLSTRFVPKCFPSRHEQNQLAIRIRRKGSDLISRFDRENVAAVIVPSNLVIPLAKDGNLQDILSVSWVENTLDQLAVLGGTISNDEIRNPGSQRARSPRRAIRNPQILPNMDMGSIPHPPDDAHLKDLNPFQNAPQHIAHSRSWAGAKDFPISKVFCF